MPKPASNLEGSLRAPVPNSSKMVSQEASVSCRYLCAAFTGMEVVFSFVEGPFFLYMFLSELPLIPRMNIGNGANFIPVIITIHYSYKGKLRQEI